MFLYSTQVYLYTYIIQIYNIYYVINDYNWRYLQNYKDNTIVYALGIIIGTFRN